MSLDKARSDCFFRYSPLQYKSLVFAMICPTCEEI